MSREDAEQIIKGLVYTGEKADTVKESRKPLVQKKVMDNSPQCTQIPGAAVNPGFHRETHSQPEIYLQKAAEDKRIYERHGNDHFSGGCLRKSNDARISKSSINDKEFTDHLSAYVMNIRFKPVPEEVGNMSFEFPFEFNPE
jgi:hypothetical protein